MILINPKLHELPPKLPPEFVEALRGVNVGWLKNQARLVPKADNYHSVALMSAAQRRADKSEQPD